MEMLMPDIIVSLAVLTVNFPHSFLVFFTLKMLLQGQGAGAANLAMTTVEMLVIIVSLAVLTVNSLHSFIVFFAPKVLLP